MCCCLQDVMPDIGPDAQYMFLKEVKVSKDES